MRFVDLINGLIIVLGIVSWVCAFDPLMRSQVCHWLACLLSSIGKEKNKSKWKKGIRRKGGNQKMSLIMLWKASAYGKGSSFSVSRPLQGWRRE